MGHVSSPWSNFVDYGLFKTGKKTQKTSFPDIYNPPRVDCFYSVFDLTAAQKNIHGFSSMIRKGTLCLKLNFDVPTSERLVIL